MRRKSYGQHWDKNLIGRFFNVVFWCYAETGTFYRGREAERARVQSDGKCSREFEVSSAFSGAYCVNVSAFNHTRRFILRLDTDNSRNFNFSHASCSTYTHALTTTLSSTLLAGNRAPQNGRADISRGNCRSSFLTVYRTSFSISGRFNIVKPLLHLQVTFSYRVYRLLRTNAK